jgi:hypothetical protein
MLKGPSGPFSLSGRRAMPDTPSPLAPRSSLRVRPGAPARLSRTPAPRAPHSGPGPYSGQCPRTPASVPPPAPARLPRTPASVPALQSRRPGPLRLSPAFRDRCGSMPLPPWPQRHHRQLDTRRASLQRRSAVNPQQASVIQEPLRLLMSENVPYMYWSRRFVSPIPGKNLTYVACCHK